MNTWSNVERWRGIVETINAFYAYGTSTCWNDWLSMSYITFLPIAHSLSLIDYSTTSQDEELDPPEKHLLLQRNTRMYVWGYFMASRTSLLGIIVAVCGCLVVLVQGYLGFAERRRYRSSTQHLMAALEHVPRGEFEGKRHDERVLARIRFHVEDLHGRGMKFSSAKEIY